MADPIDKTELFKALTDLSGVDPEKLKRRLRRWLREFIRSTPSIISPGDGANVLASYPLLVSATSDDNTVAWDVAVIEKATGRELARIPCPPAAEVSEEQFDFGAEFPARLMRPGSDYYVRVEANGNPSAHNTAQHTVHAVIRLPVTNHEGTTTLRE